MCEIYNNLQFAISHIDEILNNLEEYGDEYDLKRNINNLDQCLTSNKNEEPDYIEKRNNIFKAFIDFIEFLRKRSW